MKPLATLLLAALLALSTTSSFAVNPDELLTDPALEARAEAIGSSLRCLVCQNESIEASDADLAHDLRVLVRERLKAGDTDDQAKQYIVDRYGEFVLLQPVFALHTLILWLAAPALIIVGGLALFIAGRRRKAVATHGSNALSAEEIEALEKLSAPPEQ